MSLSVSLFSSTFFDYRGGLSSLLCVSVFFSAFHWQLILSRHRQSIDSTLFCPPAFYRRSCYSFLTTSPLFCPCCLKLEAPSFLVADLALAHSIDTVTLYSTRTLVPPVTPTVLPLVIASVPPVQLSPTHTYITRAQPVKYPYGTRDQP